MANQDYIPRSEGKLVQWLGQVRAKFASVAAPLGVPAATIASLETHCDSITEAVKQARAARQDSKAAHTTKRSAKTEGLKEIRRAFRQLKTKKGYTTAKGVGLQAIGKRPEVEVDNARPSLRVRKVAVGWEIRYGLMGFFHGVDIFRKRQREANWRFIATDTSSPYIDTEPQVSGTQYRAVFRLKDERVGKTGNSVVVEV